jgi:hydrogenase maturation protease
MIAVIGIGSTHGDDQIGWIAIDRLRASPPPGVSLHQVRGGIELLECLEGQKAAILIDTAAPAGLPGTIRSFVWPCPDLAEAAPWSTHGLGLVDALRLAETLGRIPRTVWIDTMEASQNAPGAAPSPEVLAQLDVLLEALRHRIASITPG